MIEARPLADWCEEDGPVLWWKFPVQEPPYVGTPLDIGVPVEVSFRDCVRTHTWTRYAGGWPGYHTHWTPIEVPVERMTEPELLDALETLAPGR